MKKIISISIILVLAGVCRMQACTGLALTAKDGSHILARTIEWGDSFLPSEYVVIPRGYEQVSYTPTGKNGMAFRAKYGVVGLAIVQPEFIAEGLNEAGLSAGLFYFPRYGQYVPYDTARNNVTVSDLQLAAWMLTQFATVDEVKAAIDGIRIVGIEQSGATSTLHWRIGDASGKQVVLEIIDGIVYFYDNEVGVLTNSPGFLWQMTNLNNYVNIYPGGAIPHKLGNVMLTAFGAGSGFRGIPGDVTPPSRFVRIAFYRNTAPQQKTAKETVFQCFHILNNFDVPIGIEHPLGKAPDIPSATQWTSVVDLTNRRIYYKTAYNNTIRCVNLKGIDFSRVAYQKHPLDRVQEQPVEEIRID